MEFIKIDSINIKEVELLVYLLYAVLQSIIILL